MKDGKIVEFKDVIRLAIITRVDITNYFFVIGYTTKLFVTRVMDWSWIAVSEGE